MSLLNTYDTPSLIIPGMSVPASVQLNNLSDVPIYVGDSNVTPSTGALIPPRTRITYNATRALFAVSDVKGTLRIDGDIGGGSLNPTVVSGAVTAQDGAYYLAGAAGTVFNVPSWAKAGFSFEMESGCEGTVKWALPANWTNQYGDPFGTGRPVLSYRGAIVRLTVISPGKVQVSSGNAGYVVPLNDYHITDAADLQICCQAGFEHQWSNAGNVNDATALPPQYALRWGPRFGTDGFVYSPDFNVDTESYCPYLETDPVTLKPIYNMRVLAATQRGWITPLLPTTPHFTVAMAIRVKATAIDGQILQFSDVASGAAVGGVEGLRYINNTHGWQDVGRNLLSYGAWTGNAVTETTNAYLLWAEWNAGKFNCWLNGTLRTTEHGVATTYVTPVKMILRGNSSLSPSIAGYVQINGLLSAGDRTKAMAQLQAMFLP